MRSAHLAGRLSEDGLAAERQKLAQWADAYEQAIPAGEALLRSRYRQLSAMQTVCIAGAGAAWGVDPQLITAIIAIESGGNPAALKLMETLQIPACAYELEEFLHGPELHLTPNHTLFFLASDPHDRARGAQLSRAASLVTEKTFFFTDDGGDLPVPSSPDALAHRGFAPLAQAPAGGRLRVRRQRKKRQLCLEGSALTTRHRIGCDRKVKATDL